MMLQTNCAQVPCDQQKHTQPSRSEPNQQMTAPKAKKKKKKAPIARSKMLLQDDSMRLNFATGLPHTRGQRMATTPVSVSPPMITFAKARKGGMALEEKKRERSCREATAGQRCRE